MEGSSPTEPAGGGQAGEAFPSEAGSFSAALAPITGVIGTIVGAYFGVQVGAAGKSEAEAARTSAESDAKKLAIVAPPAAAMSILGIEPSQR